MSFYWYFWASHVERWRYKAKDKWQTNNSTSENHKSKACPLLPAFDKAWLDIRVLRKYWISIFSAKSGRDVSVFDFNNRKLLRLQRKTNQLSWVDLHFAVYGLPSYYNFYLQQVGVAFLDYSAFYLRSNLIFRAQKGLLQDLVSTMESHWLAENRALNSHYYFCFQIWELSWAYLTFCLAVNVIMDRTP